MGIEKRLETHCGYVRAIALGTLISAACVGAHAQEKAHWITTWGSAQLTSYGNEILPAGAFDGATLRETVHISAGGAKFRLQLANTFGHELLTLRAVYVQVEKAGATETVPVQFGAAASVVIPEESEMLSDVVQVPLQTAADIVVTIVIDHAPSIVTFHAGAHATAMLAPGDHAADAVLPSAKTFTSWYFLSGIQVSGSPSPGSVVTLGDSITDGHGSTTDGNDRWPDLFARRLQQAAGRAAPAVVNEGIGGNCILQVCLGPNALTRFDRDVIAVAGTQSLLVLEGINDIGSLDRLTEHSQAEHDALVAELESAFTQMTERAHEHGLRIFAGTLTPFLGSDYYHPTPRTEADRQALNDWIRSTKIFDGVVDFDAAVRDPARPGHLLAVADSGDHLHPGPAGYALMASAVPLRFFLQPFSSAKGAHVPWD